MSFLRSILGRMRPARESVELDPAGQITLRYLLQFGPRTVDDIMQEANGSRVTPRTEVDAAIAHLVEFGLVEVTPPQEPGQTQNLYAATPRSSVLRDRIPQEPRTVTEFYF
jgi:predicted transcriptional regulator